MKRWLTERFGIVRLRQLVEELQHRLSFLPIVLVVVAVLVSQITLALDRQLADVDVPSFFETGVDSSRSVLATIAGGLITTFTLLLSMMLVAVQLASSNFSPRTLRNWLGDRRLRWSIAVVLATTVFCLMGLRSVRADADSVSRPTITVFAAVLLALASLIMVIRAVDHVAGSMQVGAVANRLVESTLDTLRQSREAFESATTTPRPRLTGSGALDTAAPEPPSDATAVETRTPGYIQQIDEATLCAALSGDGEIWLAVAHGDYVTTRSPLLYVSRDVDIEAPHDGHGTVAGHLAHAFAIGETRTMQQDVGFGIAQLSDIAVRALSPGINDPETASGVLLNMGEILREIWTLDPVDETVERDGRIIHRRVASHADMLRAALDSVRRYGRADPDVMITMASVVRHLRAEAERCALPGPSDVLTDYLAEIALSADTTGWLDREIERLRIVTR